MTVTLYREPDWPEIWALLQIAFAAGDSYPCPIDMAEADAREYWVQTPKWTYAARDERGVLVGTFYIRPDQGGLGDHICNCGYVVAPAARGRGVGAELALYSQAAARQHGFNGMRYNLVVATNKPALRAWEKCGMQIVGTVPKAFRHKDLGLVDAHIMYKWLADDDPG